MRDKYIVKKERFYMVVTFENSGLQMAPLSCTVAVSSGQLVSYKPSSVLTHDRWREYKPDRLQSDTQKT